MSCPKSDRQGRPCAHLATQSSTRARAAPTSTIRIVSSLAALGLCTASAQTLAVCTVPGSWVDSYGGNVSVAAALTGTMRLPYCGASHSLTITLVGTSGFNVDARYSGGGDCQGFVERLTFSADCKSATGTYTNDDGNTGTDTWTRTGPTIALTRASLTSITATGAPAGGVFDFSTVLLSGANVATLAQADGFTNRSNPDQLTLTAPGGGGGPSPGGLERLVAKYTVDGVDATNDLNTLATFGMSCYMVALEADYGTPPAACSATRIGGVSYTGALIDPNGLTGSYCASFIANVRLQGTGQLNAGGFINYSPATGLMTPVPAVTGADGTAVIAGGSVARDRAIIPGRGVLVDVDGVGNGLLANDTGGAIRGYRLDLFNGAGRAACAGYTNPHGVGACQTPQGTTCPGSALR